MARDFSFIYITDASAPDGQDEAFRIVFNILEADPSVGIFSAGVEELYAVNALDTEDLEESGKRCERFNLALETDSFRALVEAAAIASLPDDDDGF